MRRTRGNAQSHPEEDALPSNDGEESSAGANKIVDHKAVKASIIVEIHKVSASMEEIKTLEGRRIRRSVILTKRNGYKARQCRKESVRNGGNQHGCKRNAFPHT